VTVHEYIRLYYSSRTRNRFFFLRKIPNRLYAASFLKFPNHTQLDTHSRGTLPKEWSARRRGR